MIEIVCLLMMCIVKIVYMSIPTLLVVILIQASIYKIVGISIYKEICKMMLKGVK